MFNTYGTTMVCCVCQWVMKCEWEQCCMCRQRVLSVSVSYDVWMRAMLYVSATCVVCVSEVWHVWMWAMLCVSARCVVCQRGVTCVNETDVVCISEVWCVWMWAMCLSEVWRVWMWATCVMCVSEVWHVCEWERCCVCQGGVTCVKCCVCQRGVMYVSMRAMLCVSARCEYQISSSDTRYARRPQQILLTESLWHARYMLCNCTCV